MNVSEASLNVPHCPSISGCRSVILQPDGLARFLINDNFTATLKVSDLIINLLNSTAILFSGNQ